MKNERVLTILVVLSMCVWGMSWSSAKVLSGYGAPMNIAIIRVSFTFLAFIPTMIILKETVIVKTKGIKYVLGAGVLLTCYALLFFKGLSQGLSGIGGVIVTTISPLFAYLIGITLKRKLPAGNELKGLLIGLLAGLILLQVWKSNQTYFSTGVLYFFVAAFVWAALSKFTSKANFYGNIIGFSWWMHLMTLIALSFIAEIPEVLLILQNGDTKFWANMITFAIMNSTVATTTYFYATNIIGPERAGSFMFIVPAGAVFSSWVFLGEPLQIHTLIGGVLGILAVLMINGKLKKKKKAVN